MRLESLKLKLRGLREMEIYSSVRHSKMTRANVTMHDWEIDDLFR
jgi:hypothetical protein